jgi:phage baseplate assembly protein W
MAGFRDRSKEYLGQGLAFPLQVDARGQIALVSAERDIEQSIGIILATSPGERVMRPEFGCRAHELLFEPMHVGTVALMRQYVAEALTMWEPRIEVQAVNVYVDPDHDGALLVEIYYLIKETHDERSIVFPFFLVGQEEG